MDKDPVNLQRLTQHLGDPVAAGTYVGLIGRKHLGETFLVPDQLCQLVIHRLQHSQLVAPVSCCFFQRLNGRPQVLLNRLQLCFQSRQASFDLVIPVRIRRNTGDIKHLPVNPVQLQHTVLHLPDDSCHFAQYNLHPQGMFPCRQMDQVRFSLLPGQRFQAPVLGIGEGRRLELGKRNLPVYIDFAVYVRSADKILLIVKGNGVVSFLRHGKAPLNPLAGAFPRVSADTVVQQVAGAGGGNRTGGLILHRIEHLGGCPGGSLRLDPDKLSGGAGFPFRFPVWLRVCSRPEAEAADQHRLPQGQDRKRMRAAGQENLQAFTDVAV